MEAPPKVKNTGAHPFTLQYSSALFFYPLSGNVNETLFELPASPALQFLPDYPHFRKMCSITTNDCITF
ncbi:hypothetical protein ACH3XW_34975 [Acanthocheilonema viteae]